MKSRKFTSQLSLGTPLMGRLDMYLRFKLHPSQRKCFVVFYTIVRVLLPGKFLCRQDSLTIWATVVAFFGHPRQMMPRCWNLICCSRTRSVNLNFQITNILILYYLNWLKLNFCIFEMWTLAKACLLFLCPQHMTS